MKRLTPNQTVPTQCTERPGLQQSNRSDFENMNNTEQKPTLKKKAMYRLTVKQERFCQEYIKTGNASEAYRIAYDSSGMLPATVNRRAKDLIDNSKLRDRIAELQAPAVKQARITLESHLAELHRIKLASEAAGKYASALRAEELRGKLSGFYREPGKAEPITRIVITRKKSSEIEAEINGNDSEDAD